MEKVIKLPVQDYLLVIDGKDISDVYVSTELYDNEKLINIELTGKDSNNNEAWISFEIKSDLEYLNSLSSTPTDITKLLFIGESFIKKPNEQYSGFLDFNIPNNNLDDMYKILSSLWIYKIKENEFYMKLFVADEVFTFFKLVLN